MALPHTMDTTADFIHTYICTYVPTYCTVCNRVIQKTVLLGMVYI